MRQPRLLVLCAGLLLLGGAISVSGDDNTTQGHTGDGAHALPEHTIAIRVCPAQENATLRHASKTLAALSTAVTINLHSQHSSYCSMMTPALLGGNMLTWFPNPARSQRADGAEEGPDDGAGRAGKLERHRRQSVQLDLRDLRLRRPCRHPVRSCAAGIR